MVEIWDHVLPDWLYAHCRKVWSLSVPTAWKSRLKEVPTMAGWPTRLLAAMSDTLVHFKELPSLDT